MTIDDASLSFSVDEYSAENEARNETLFTTANGFLGFRGDDVGSDEKSNPRLHAGTYINGFYDSEPISYGESAYGYAKNHETILNLPNPKKAELFVNGEKFLLSGGACKIESYSRSLNFAKGILTRRIKVSLKDGTRFLFTSERLVSFRRAHCAAIRYSVEILSAKKKARVRFVSSIDTTARNILAEDDPRVGAKFTSSPLIIEDVFSKGGVLGFSARTRNSGLKLNGSVLHEASQSIKIEAAVENEIPSAVINWTLASGEKAELVKYICYSDTDGKTENLSELRSFAAAGFEKASSEQEEFLRRFWLDAKMAIEGSAADQIAVNYNLFQLLQSASRSGNASIAAKGLTAEGYEGHFFWDSEAYIAPVFTYTMPSVAEALLKYRAKILPAAKARAKEMSLKGALFPWRTISGNETSAYFPAGTAQYHIDADIVFALERFLYANENSLNLLTQKDIVEIAVETARMWMSLGSFVPEKGGTFCINQVTGPDEYTACVNNNAYTNLMARENLEFSARIAKKYKAASKSEIASWNNAAKKMFIPYDEKSGIYAQDDSFLQKAPWDFAGTPKENYPLLLHYHPLVIYRHRVLKQPDLVLAQFYLSDKFTREERIRNFLFYEKYTTGDSSLSPCIQSIAAADAADIKKAKMYFDKTARMDIADVNGNTCDGIHTACMAGSWMAVVYGFAGFRDYGGKYSFNPQLPSGWKRLSFNLLIQGRRLTVDVSKKCARYSLSSDSEGVLQFFHRGKKVALKPGQTKEFDLTPRLCAVLFDLDGVITDTARLHCAAWARLAKKHGLKFNEAMAKKMSGRSRMDSLDLMLKENGVVWTENERALACSEKNDDYVRSLDSLGPKDILPGIKVLLDDLRSRKIKCVLASASKNAPAILKKLGLTEYFHAVVDPASLEKGKPEPDIYVRAAELSGEWIDCCIGIEDAQSGIDSIKAAGIKACAVGAKLKKVDVVAASSRELSLSLLESAFAKI